MNLLFVVVGCGDGGLVPEIADVASTRCVGAWVHTTDGVPDARGREVRDDHDRVVEEEQDAIGSVGGSHSWKVWETDPSGVDRLVEQSFDSDGDDDPDQVVTWSYTLDDRLRLAAVAVRGDGSPDLETTYTYDDEDQLVLTSSTWEGETRSTWEDGRLIASETVRPEGNVAVRTTIHYEAPAPSLDRVESWWWPTSQAVTRFDVDDRGKVLAQWAIDDDLEVLVLTQVWDDEGHKVDAVATWSTSGTWGDVDGETHTTWTRDAKGRLSTVRAEEDTHADGVIETVDVWDWSWSCE